MKTEEIINGNKLIAEFMTGEKYNTFYLPEFGHYFNSYGNIEYTETFSIDELKYHSSLDWLIPVVEKIAIIPTNYPNGIFKYLVNIELNLITGIKIEDMYKRNFDQDGFSFEEYKFSFIENVWLGCVEFIKWYNENHKN